MRVFGHPNGLKFDLRAASARKMKRTLPKVSVIGTLVIRRQFYRAFSAENGLKTIIESCTQLHTLSYESWRGINKNGFSGIEVRANEHQVLFSNLVQRRDSLRTVSVFEDFTLTLHKKQKRRRNMPLGQALVTSSLNLTDLHVAFNIDARDFFFAFNPEPGKKPKTRKIHWEKMKRLSLTSRLLTTPDYNQLIELAAQAAKKMPQLECMELWYAGRRYASIFRYQRSVERAKVSLLSTLKRRLSAKSKRCWRNVARRHGICDLQIEHLPLEGGLIKSYVSIFPYLVLGKRLLQPISLSQLKMEIDHT